MKATIFNLGSGIGVCHFKRDGVTYVAEVTERRILPQSVRGVVAITHMEVEVDDVFYEATSQDHIDRATLGLKRFRDRLATFDVEWADDAEIAGWTEQAIAAHDELAALLEVIA